MKNKVLGNIINYSVMIAVVLIYVSSAGAFQLLFNATPVMSMIFADSIIAVLCGGLYFLLKKKGVFSSDKPEMTKKSVFGQLGVFLFVTVTVLMIFYWISIYFPDPTMEHRENSIAKDSVTTYVIMSCIFAPIAEECMMRLFLYNLCKTKSDWVVSMIVTGLVFALMHGTISHIITGTIFAVFMTLSYENTGRWYFPIIGHMIYNFTAIFGAGYLGTMARVTPLVICLVLVLLVIMLQQMVPVLSKYAEPVEKVKNVTITKQANTYNPYVNVKSGRYGKRNNRKR